MEKIPEYLGEIVTGLVIVSILTFVIILPLRSRLLQGKVRIYHYGSGYAVKQFGKESDPSVMPSYDMTDDGFTCRWLWVDRLGSIDSEPFEMSKEDAIQVKKMLEKRFLEFKQRRYGVLEKRRKGAKARRSKLGQRVKL